MITGVIMRNFKVFEDAALPLRALNVLTGLNSSGKSSVIQALRILNMQGLFGGMGSWKEFARYESNEVELEFSRNKEDIYDLEFALAYNRSDNILNRYNYKNNPFYNNNSVNTLGFLSYISANRYGPRNTLPLRTDEAALSVGECGEYIVDFLQSIDRDEWLDGVDTPECLSIDGKSLNGNIIAWIRKISPEIGIKPESFDKTDVGRVMWDGFRAAHVGFGLSHALPIIASVLVHSGQRVDGRVPLPDNCNFEKNVLLLIENPEAHLHPAGQTTMGRLLAYAASCGVQIVVETHSDHLLNGMRIAVKEGVLSPKDFGCLFFSLPECGKKMYRDAVQFDDIRIDAHGMLEYWPTNFFDETEKNLLQLI